ncbi:N-acetylmuramoyl-L-alanine amidase [Bacillus testis]|uniref:N-acetylmuramoyl-L-alanine amidase n=1 Tax=Bacillus testis TaxID=1622072 RepID=UPI00067E7C15|nr:N-acetylmuramoyl-L-alanine amidase [Bacillus testis]
MKKGLTLLLCILVWISTLAMDGSIARAASNVFKDIPSNHRAYKEISYLAQGKIVSGDTKGYFKPKNNVTRAEFAAMLGRALGFDGTKQKTSFRDVGAGNFASGYIQQATKQKIISGYPDGTFRPNGLITRGEVATMICRAFGYSTNNTSAGSAKALVSLGISSETTANFGTASRATREASAVFIVRAINYTYRTKQHISFSSQRIVKVDSLNIRTGPSTLYNKVGTLKNNEKVSLGYRVGSWALIKGSSGVIGFVHESYLSSSSETVAPPANNTGNTSLSSQTIVIDPGHGGTDPGAVGFGLKEKDVVLDTGKRLKSLFSKTPFNIKMTRETDVFVTLQGRVAFAKNAKANTFISIHTNAGGGTGSETYYYGKAANPNVTASMKLAQFIQARLTSALSTTNRGEKHGDLHVLRENTMPAVLVELAFIDTKADNAKLASPSYRQKAAQAIYYGTLDYYKYKGFNVAKYY